MVTFVDVLNHLDFEVGPFTSFGFSELLLKITTSSCTSSCTSRTSGRARRSCRCTCGRGGGCEGSGWWEVVVVVRIESLLVEPPHVFMEAPSFFRGQCEPRAFIFRFDDFSRPDGEFVEAGVFVVGSFDERSIDAFDLHAIFEEEVAFAVGVRADDLCGFVLGVGAVIKDAVFDLARAGVVVKDDGVEAGGASRHDLMEGVRGRDDAEKVLPEFLAVGVYVVS